jgi:hypothetical protein
MRVIKDGAYYKMTYITGPCHNFLGLKFTLDPEVTEIVMEAKSIANDQGKADDIDPSLLRQKVLEGVDAANNEQDTRIRVERIQYVSTDTPRIDIYALMARALATAALHDTPPLMSHG